jgi:hypothetical protein
MSKRKGFLLGGEGSALLIAALLFTFSPMGSETAHANASPVTFANNNWNCLTAACTKTVKQGDAQPDYECAEFVARSLAYAGYMPGLSSISPQSDYDPYSPHLGNGRVYDLLLITPIAGLHTLADYLHDAGFSTNIGHDLSSAVAGDMVVFEDSNHVPQHTALIVVTGSTTSTTKVDAHNNAAYKYPLSNEIAGFSYWYILHIS